ncbi:DsbA family protein [Nonomuraea sp. 3-1Str]|uniref:DsbA family protein n=1 Tax=Nonomuraea sp. 3-1Str TaxID=2929801 RepID=UPI002859F2C3|nr:thioredoxin domain-containing protein [Nonomuraea sp. 3-1Str]MDR8413251.1 DsbA family protein [Nonomuraea sp. 3-1Str]
MSTPAHVTRAPNHVPAGVSESGDGIVVGDGPVRVDAYIDFLCPFCRMFEQASGPVLSDLVADHAIRLVYHPMGFLDGLSTNRYSSRASASSGCASDGGRFVPYAAALFAHQPPEGGPGLTDDELVELGGTVGLDIQSFGACVHSGAYLDWTAYVTAEAIRRGVSGTPTVLVEGVAVPANPRTITVAVAAAMP